MSLCQQSKSNRFLTERNSGVESLRIISMFLIVLAHIAQTIGGSTSNILVDIGSASSNIWCFIINIFYMFGAWGNLIFFLISAWFLLDSKQVKERKITYYIAEVWFISVIVLLLFKGLYQGSLSSSDVIRSIFPTVFANNWFVTCYILFYPIHTILNDIIKMSSKSRLLKISMVLFFLYVICNTLKTKLFFPSVLILWVSLYLTMGYIKFYLPHLANNRNLNILIFVSSIGSFLVLTYLMNFLGLKITAFSHQVLYWGSNYSVFWVLSGISLLNLFRIINFHSMLINKISSYMLLVYLFHENLLFRRHLRSNLFNWWYSLIGEGNVIVAVISFALILFLASLIISIIFNKCFTPLITTVTDKLHGFINKYYGKFANIILRFE